jgi:hypothetical protein
MNFYEVPTKKTYFCSQDKKKDVSSEEATLKTVWVVKGQWTT